MRRTFSASSLDTNLPLRFEGKVHSIFSKALNIKIEENELISIVAAEKLNGPNRILVELPKNKDLVALEIKQGMKVIGNGQEVRIDGGRLSISLERAERWSPEVKKEKRILNSQVKNNLSFLQKSLSVEKDENKVSQELKVRIQKLAKSIEEENLSKVPKDIKRLISFGEGLTPSGDDFLVGLIASLHFLSNLKLKHLLNKIKRIINLEKEKTTFLSGKFLEYACQGRFPETILNLIEAIFSGNREEVRETARRCLDFGATSGRDTLLGVVRGLDLIVQSQ